VDKDLKQEALKDFAQKTELERTLAVSLQGPPELKLEEKRLFLGEFRERVLVALTKAQVMSNTVYQEIEEALQDKRSAKMLIHGELAYKYREKYQRMATETGKSFTVVHDPDLQGDIGLAVASDDAVEQPDIFVPD
jgi:uncharacterized protein YueI